MKREGFLASIGALFGSSVLPFKAPEKLGLKAPEKLGRVVSVTAADSISVKYTVTLMGSARCGPINSPIDMSHMTMQQVDEFFGHAS